mmetsp:Transcript_1593/g.2591  ORF Transcript_1593/g.2591 Transcript_1593/m.2591 type:complete len:386 (+) Transcript_1593:164-1321(+)
MLRQQGGEALASKCPAEDGQTHKHRNGLKEHRFQNGHEIIQKKSGSVTNGGKKIITSTGQKVVIKFSVNKAQENSILNSPVPGKLKKNGIGKDSPSSQPLTPHIEKLKRHRGLTVASATNKGSPKISPSTPTTPRSWDWGIDDYVYGGPRTQAAVEVIKAKEIETPLWRILDQKDEELPPPGKKSRSMAVGSKYAKPKPSSQSNGTSEVTAGPYLSSDEDTDDETYLKRHKPYEEQEARFRFPKKDLEKGDKGEKEKVKTSDEVEKAYKSLWYKGDNPNGGSRLGGATSSGDERSPRVNSPRVGRPRKSSLNGTPDPREPNGKTHHEGAEGTKQPTPSDHPSSAASASNGTDSTSAIARKGLGPEPGANGSALHPVPVGVVSSSS